MTEVAQVPGTTVRVSDEVHTRLKELADETGQTLQGVLASAVELFRRQRLLLESNAAYARARADDAAGLDEGYSSLEGTLLDGLSESD